MAEPLWRTPPGRLAPPHVYRMAGALGAELRRLSARFGPDAVAGLVPPVVRLLELLEALVAAPPGAEGEAPLGPQEAEVSGEPGPAAVAPSHAWPAGEAVGTAPSRLLAFPGGWGWRRYPPFCGTALTLRFPWGRL